MKAKHEIEHLMSQYSFMVDTGNFEGYANLFEHAKWISEGHMELTGKQEILNALSNMIIYEDGTPRTKHVSANIDIIINDDKKTATAQSYITVFQQTTDFPLQPIFCGHYFDEFKIIDGVWCFTSRIVRHGLVGDTRYHMKPSFNLTSKEA